jgi:hypothetical protein
MTDEAQAIIPVDERAIDFYGDAVIGVIIEEGGERRIYVPVRPICDYLGLSWSAQFERIKRDDVLAESVRFVRVTRTNSKGGAPDVICLPLDFLPGWMFGVSPNRVKPELKERITLYKRECYRRLWDAFKHEILPATTELAPAQPAASGAQLAYELATAVQNLAREQMDMEQRLGGRIDRMAHWAKGVVAKIDDLDARVGGLELHVGPALPISEQQAAEVALAVKNVGRALSERGTKPGYSQVYGELYRRYGISSYKNLPQDRYAEVLAWLKGWYDELVALPPISVQP